MKCSPMWHRMNLSHAQDPHTSVTLAQMTYVRQWIKRFYTSADCNQNEKDRIDETLASAKLLS